MTARAWALAIALGSFGAVLLALLSQHVFGMQPCPWCILQRLVFVLIGVVALAAAHVHGSARVLLSAGMLLLALAGASAALYQNLVASKSQSCNLTLADRIVSGLGIDRALPPVFEVRGSCADAAVRLVGVPYELWSLALYALIAATAVMVMRGAER